MSSTRKISNPFNKTNRPDTPIKTDTNLEEAKEAIIETRNVSFGMLDKVEEVTDWDAKKELKLEETKTSAYQNPILVENWRQKWPLFKFLQNVQRKGLLFLSALLKIGIVYGFVATLKWMENKLWHNKTFIGIIYRGFYHFNSYLLHSLFLFISYQYAIAYVLFDRYAPKEMQQKVMKMYNAVTQWYFKEDEKLAAQLTEFIEEHQWMKKTTLELLDDMVHWIVTKVEHIFGLPSKMTIIRKQIEKYQEIFSQFHQTHLQSIPANFLAQKNAKTASQTN